MTPEQSVRGKWADAKTSKAFAVQPDGSRKWMYCVMSALKFVRTRSRKGHPRVMNIGSWQFSEAEAWSAAARAEGGAKP